MKRRDVVIMGAAIAATGMAARVSAQTTPATPAPPSIPAPPAGATPTPGTATTASTASDAKPFTAAQLDQMLAPLALYPDALMAQILMASTYPLEVVEAARWSKDNPTLKGDAALAAVKDKGWDVSVTSLVAFPQVLQMMNSKLDWVQNVGDAMLAQQSDVAASIQRLRAQAQTAGTLKTTPQQTVVQQPPSAGAPAGTPPAIVIQPTNPDVVYVPTYNPATAYGPWPYPDYPPTYFPPSPGWGYDMGSALLGGLAFGVGFAVGNAFFGGWGWGGGWGGGWGWGGWGGWGGSHSWTTININRSTRIVNNFNDNHYHDGHWHHDPAHRHGVPYRDRHEREKYGQHHPGAAEREAFRGKVDRDARANEQRRDEERANAERANERRAADERKADDRRADDKRADDRRADDRRADERRDEDRRSADARSRDNRGDWHRNALNSVNHAHEMHREAARGHSYDHHASVHRSGGGGGHRGGRR